MKSLFREDGSYTPEGVELHNDLEKYFTKLIREWKARDYSSREIAYIMIDSVHLAELIARRR